MRIEFLNKNKITNSDKKNSSFFKKSNFSTGKIILMAIATILIVVSSSYLAFAEGSASIWTTDAAGNPQEDFAPDSDVYIWGDGFKANDYLDSLCITLPDGVTQECAPIHPKFSSEDNLPFTDGNGAFSMYKYDLDGIDGEYTITAEDADGTTAIDTFTDSRTINWVKVDGGSTVTVSPGATIEVEINVTVNGWGYYDWKSTKYQIEGGSTVCEDTPDHYGKGTWTETFDIIAPTSPGVYDVKFKIYKGESCTSFNSDWYILTDGITVSTPQTCTDNDQDNYDACDGSGNPISGCDNPCDCNDSNANIHPGKTEVCDDGIDNDCDGNVDCDDSDCQPCATIYAYKIVCDYESDLPNWGDTSTYITSSTAQDYVNSHQNCSLESGWNFQWAFDTSNPGDNIERAGTPWTTFGPTDSNGKTQVQISNADSGTLKFREELKPNYLQFSGVGGSDITAEFYCDGDVLNYDNYDFINENIQDGDEYYCVAFNVLANHCGNGVLESGEECDDGKNNGVVCTPEYENSCDYCSNTCNITTIIGPYCGDGILNGPEECDNDDWGNVDECSDVGEYNYGELSCTQECVFNTSECGLDNNCPDVEVLLPPDTTNVTWYSGIVNIKATIADYETGVKEARVILHNSPLWRDPFSPSLGFIMTYNELEGRWEYNWDSTLALIPNNCSIVNAQVFGEDNAGNGADNQCSDTNRFGIDNAPPITTKTIGEPSVDKEVGDNYYVKTTTQFNLTATDCGSGVDYIHYEIWWDSDNNTEVDTIVSNETVYDDEVSFYFQEESIHEIRWYAVDKLGNTEEEHVQEHAVDDTAPELIKTVGNPKRNASNYEGIDGPTPWKNKYDWYVTQNTPITLTCKDLGPHPVDNVTIHWYWEWANEGQQSGMSNNYSYNGNSVTFNYTEDSWHHLHYWCEDALGNEISKDEYDVVDTKAPEVNKTIGDPNVPTGIDSDKFSGEGYQNPIDQNDAIDYAYFITQDTPIILTCQDQDPHPVDNVTIYYKYYNDGHLVQDWTKYTGAFTYGNDTYHQLYYYCEDALGNKGPIHYELDIVDTQAPVTTKTIGNPKYNDSGEMWITNATPITLNCTDQDPHPVDNVVLHWRWKLDDGNWTSWNNVSGGYVNIPPEFFENDSNHRLQWYCEDALGNKENITEELDRIDSQPPVTTKTFDGPTCAEGNETNYWVTSNTNITLTAVDQADPCAVGIDYLHYEIWRSTDNGSTWTLLNEYDVNNNRITFNFNEECLHKIKWYAVDKLGNKEEWNEQYHRVDNTPPKITKKIGWPSNYWGNENGEDVWEITSDTNITLTAVDQAGLCAVGGGSIQYRIWYDLTGEWSEWYTYTGEPFNLYGDSTHRLEIIATDCLGNTANDVETFIVHENYPGDSCILPRDIEVFGPYWKSFELPNKFLIEYTNDTSVWNVLKLIEGEYGILYFRDSDGHWTSFDPLRINNITGEPLNDLTTFDSDDSGTYWIKMTGPTRDRGYIPIFNDLKDNCEMTLPECWDRLDNDGDGYWDYGYDPECQSQDDDTETPVCGNSIIETGEECESDGDCNEGKVCESCQCVPSQTTPE